MQHISNCYQKSGWPRKVLEVNAHQRSAKPEPCGYEIYIVLLHLDGLPFDLRACCGCNCSSAMTTLYANLEAAVASPGHFDASTCLSLFHSLHRERWGAMVAEEGECILLYVSVQRHIYRYLYHPLLLVSDPSVWRCWVSQKSLLNTESGSSV